MYFIWLAGWPGQIKIEFANMKQGTLHGRAAQVVIFAEELLSGRRPPRWFGGKPEFGQRTKNGFTNYESSLLVMILI